MKEYVKKMARGEQLTLTEERERYADGLATLLHLDGLTWRDIKRTPHALKMVEKDCRMSMASKIYLRELANDSSREQWLTDILDRV